MKAWRDPIVEEIRRIREAQAAEHDFDIRRIVRAAQQEEQILLKGRLVSFPPRKVGVGLRLLRP